MYVCASVCLLARSLARSLTSRLAAQVHDVLPHGRRQLALARVHVPRGPGPGLRVRHRQVHRVAPPHVARAQQRREDRQVRARVLGVCGV